MDFKYKYRVITLTLSGSESDVEFQVNGAQIYYHSSLSNTQIKIRLFDRANDQIPLNVKQQITAPFDKFYLTATAADTVILYVANPKEIKFEGVSATVDSLSNQIRDDSFRYFTDQQSAFMGGHWWTPAASNYGLIELFNPAGSGKIAYVLSLKVLQVVNLPCYVNKVSTQLSSPTAIAKTNKFFKATPTASVMNLQRKDDTTLPTVTDFIDFEQQNSTGTYAISIVNRPSILADPLRLAEGYGVRVSSTTVALGLGAIFEWIEL